MESPIPQTVCILLEEAGFMENCSTCYLRGSSSPVPTRSYTQFDPDRVLLLCPTYDQVIEWFVQEHALYIGVYRVMKEKDGMMVDVGRWGASIVDMSTKTNPKCWPSPTAKIRHRCLDLAIERAIEVIKERIIQSV